MLRRSKLSKNEVVAFKEEEDSIAYYTYLLHGAQSFLRS
jgi:hypothetical protein